MPHPATHRPDHVSTIREFNRFYTARLGFLRKNHLDGDFSLTEARTLYEIGSRPAITASDLRQTLALDRGYISRILASLTRRKLIRQSKSPTDARERLLALTSAGERTVAGLNESSDRHISSLLDTIEPQVREDFVCALKRAHDILNAPSRQAVSI